MRSIRFNTFLVALFALLISLSSCKKDDEFGEHRIIGTWSLLSSVSWGQEDDEAHHYFHFRQDGTYLKIYVYKDGDYFIDNGKWGLRNDNEGYQLRITAHPFGDDRTGLEYYTVSFQSEDSMILTEEIAIPASTMTYLKVPDSTISQYL